MNKAQHTLSTDLNGMTSSPGYVESVLCEVIERGITVASTFMNMAGSTYTFTYTASSSGATIKYSYVLTPNPGPPPPPPMTPYIFNIDNAIVTSLDTNITSETVCVGRGGYRYGLASLSSAKPRFNGMEKVNEIAGEGNDFPIAIGIGARIYDGRLGRWLSMDPLMKLFPDISAYVGIDNCPIVFSDIDGRVLEIKSGDNTYNYCSGKLFNKDGTEADLTNDTYASSVLAELNTLTRSPTAQLIIEKIMNDNTYSVTIEMLNDIEIENKCKGKYREVHNTIYFDPNQLIMLPTTIGLVEECCAFTLIHEISHAYINFYEKKMENPWYYIGDRVVLDDEILATHFENKVRSELGSELRTHYGLLEDKETGELEADEQSRILNNDGTSVFIYSDERIHFKQSFFNGNGPILPYNYRRQNPREKRQEENNSNSNDEINLESNDTTYRR